MSVLLMWMIATRRIFKDVVDELLAEVAAEAAAGAAAAESFALDMLVSAVAFSQGKFGLGVFGMQQPGSGTTPGTAALGATDPAVNSNRLSDLAREAALLQKAVYREGTGDAAEAGMASWGVKINERRSNNVMFFLSWTNRKTVGLCRVCSVTTPLIIDLKRVLQVLGRLLAGL
jgi:hypothetical protein